MQATLVGLPLLFLVRELPEAYYLLLVFVIFIICMTVLTLIFAPKIASSMSHSDASQRRILTESMRTSSKAPPPTTNMIAPPTSRIDSIQRKSHLSSVEQAVPAPAPILPVVGPVDPDITHSYSTTAMLD